MELLYQMSHIGISATFNGAGRTPTVYPPALKLRRIFSKTVALPAIACPLEPTVGFEPTTYLPRHPWSQLPDSNRPPTVYKTVALPDELSWQYG